MVDSEGTSRLISRFRLPCLHSNSSLFPVLSPLSRHYDLYSFSNRLTHQLSPLPYLLLNHHNIQYTIYNTQHAPYNPSQINYHKHRLCGRTPPPFLSASSHTSFPPGLHNIFSHITSYHAYTPTVQILQPYMLTVLSSISHVIYHHSRIQSTNPKCNTPILTTFVFFFLSR